MIYESNDAPLSINLIVYYQKHLLEMKKLPFMKYYVFRKRFRLPLISQYDLSFPKPELNEGFSPNKMFMNDTPPNAGLLKTHLVFPLA